MYDDAFIPLGLQDGGVHPTHERKFFLTSEPAQ